MRAFSVSILQETLDMLHNTLYSKESSYKNVSPVTFWPPDRLYTATEMDVARPRQNWHGRNTMVKKHSTDTPLSQTNVSLSLSLIQKQCEELLNLDETELSLEDPEELAASGKFSCNPYDHSE